MTTVPQMNVLFLIQTGEPPNHFATTYKPILTSSDVTDRVLQCVLGVLDHEGVRAIIEPRDDLSAVPKGVEAWKEAGIPEADIEQWFVDKIEEIHDCAKDLAHNEAAGMTAADFYEEYLADTMTADKLLGIDDEDDEPDVMGDECLLCGQSLDDHDDDMCPEEDDQ